MKNLRTFIFIILVLFCLLGIAENATSAPIGPGAFGPSAITESFEGLSVGPNVTFWQGGYLVPGTTSAYTFSSGITLTNPIPNDTDHTLIGDFSLGAINHGLGAYGDVNNVGQVPDGTALLLYNHDTDPFDFNFSSDILRVGAYVTCADDNTNTVTLNVYDSGNTLLESQSVPCVDISNLGTNFIGIQNSGGIQRIEFIGAYMVIDLLTFEEGVGVQVPTMNEWGLIIFMVFAGLGAIYYLRKKRIAG